MEKYELASWGNGLVKSTRCVTLCKECMKTFLGGFGMTIKLVIYIIPFFQLFVYMTSSWSYIDYTFQSW